LVFGDSLSAGYGLKPGQSWPDLLQHRLTDKGYGDVVVNASISGETSSGGIARLPRALQQHKPDIVILELGANDGLRGLPLSTIRGNLHSLIAIARATRAKVLLVGIQLPPNYGPVYTRQFRDLFAQLASEQRTPLVPFLLEGVALNDSLMQADGLHPNAAGQPLILETVWTALSPLLAR
jgi:acyl-CoA thioesterase-1